MKSYLKMFRNYVNFGGYTSRSDFWKAFGINTLIYIILSVVSNFSGQENGILNLIFSLYYLITVLPILAMTIRRLRDAGKNIANLLWGFVPLIGQIVLIIKLIQPSLEENDRG